MKEPRIRPSDFYQKDKAQVKLQEMINNHYTEPEKYETYESSINQ